MKRTTIINTVVLALALLMAQCGSLSLSPFGGGGTETGNPGMYECAHAVFSEIDSTSRWTVTGYLPGGEQQLDPNCLFTQKPIPPLGKCTAGCAAGTGDTLVIARDSMSTIVVIVTRYDTVVAVDTLYPSSSVIQNLIVQDTLRPELQAPENSIVVVDRVVPITVQRIDTVIKRDTTRVPQRDTFYFPLSDSTAIYGRFHRPNSIPVVFIPVPNPGSFVSYNMARVFNDDFPQNSNYVSLSRTAAVRGTVMFEKYSDDDNDGFLFRPDPLQLSAYQFNDIRQNSPPPARFSRGFIPRARSGKLRLRYVLTPAPITGSPRPPTTGFCRSAGKSGLTIK